MQITVHKDPDLNYWCDECRKNVQGVHFQIRLLSPYLIDLCPKHANELISKLQQNLNRNIGGLK